MRLGIMQPYFFPYLGYFELIAKTDRWVVFDVVQYNPKSWMNRNRILRPDSGWQYINIPVHKNNHGTPIHDIRVMDRAAALARINGQLRHYQRHAPCYPDVIDLIRHGFNTAESDRLVDVNVATLAAVCEYLGLKFDWSLCSKLELDLADIDAPGHWALSICRQLGASGYLNPPGGRELFNPDEWSGCGIKLDILEPARLEYQCRPYRFEPDLSIVDVLMWNPPKTVREIIKST
jgi:hypothetical protein